MATQHARNTYFSWNNGSERDLSSFIKDIQFTQKTDNTDTTTFTSAALPAKTFLLGFTERDLKISGLFDPTATTGPDAVLSADLGGATARVWIYGPYGSTTGNIKYTGSGFLDLYDLKGNVGSAVAFDANVKVTGAVTRTTF